MQQSVNCTMLLYSNKFNLNYTVQKRESHLRVPRDGRLIYAARRPRGDTRERRSRAGTSELRPSCRAGDEPDSTAHTWPRVRSSLTGNHRAVKHQAPHTPRPGHHGRRVVNSVRNSPHYQNWVKWCYASWSPDSCGWGHVSVVPTLQRFNGHGGKTQAALLCLRADTER